MKPQNNVRIGAVLLAGGLATRMGGGNKGFKQVAGKPIIEHILETLKDQIDFLSINANHDHDAFSPYGFDVIPDSLPGFLGPLAGILSGMQWLHEKHPECQWLLSVPTDTPFIPNDLVSRLYTTQNETDAQIVMAHSNGYDHPVVALWPVALRNELHTALVQENIRKLKKWAARYKLERTIWDCTPQDPFFNINSPDDLRSLTPSQTHP